MILLVALMPVLALSALRFSFSSSLIPHPDKMDTGGEDSFYAHQQLLVVADGVGGWRRRGIDSGLFSRALCENANKYYSLNPQRYNKNPQLLIKKSQENNHNDGSSTVVMLTINSEARLLKTSQVGDSRYLIIRNKRLLFESKQQLHAFNFPYQLGRPSAKPNTCWKHAVNNQHPIKNLDIVIVGSDGLFDNIFINDIISIIKNIGEFDGKYLQNKEEVANYLTNLAILNGKNTRYISPFSMNAKKYRKFWRGGKLDDTTIIIAQVVEDDEDDQGESSDESTTSASNTSSTSSKEEKGRESKRSERREDVSSESSAEL